MIDLRKKDDMIAAIEEILQQEALKGNQHLIDKNKNNKVDPEDFKILRGEKKAVKEEETVDEGIKDVAKKAFKALTGGSDEDQRKDLQRKMGLPQTGKKPTPQKEEVEIVYEANIQPTSAKSRSHIGNLSNPTVNSVEHSGKQIGLITKQSNGQYHAHHSAAKLAHAAGSTFDNKDSAHQFIRNAHAKAIKSGTLSDRFLKKEEVVDESLLGQLRDRGNVATGQKQQDRKNFDTNTGAALKPNSTISGIRAKMQNKVQEESEQIDELSKSTLGSYVKKAAADSTISRKIGADFENRASKARSPSMKDANTSLADKFKSDSRKRKAGIDKAVDRLAKEDVDVRTPKTLRQFKEGWEEMMADVKKRAEPKPNGGSGVKQGSRYGGSKQKDTPEQDTEKK